MPKIQPKFRKVTANADPQLAGGGLEEEEEPEKGSRCCCGWRCCCLFIIIGGTCPFAYSRYEANSMLVGQKCGLGSASRGSPLCCDAALQAASILTPVAVPCGSRIGWLMPARGKAPVAGNATWQFPVSCSMCQSAKPIPPPVCGKSWTTLAGNFTCGERILQVVSPKKGGYAKQMMAMFASKKKQKPSTTVLQAAQQVANQFPKQCKACSKPASTGCECDYRPELGGSCVKSSDGLPWCYVKPGCKSAFPGARGDISVAPCLQAKCFCDPSVGLQGYCNSAEGAGPKALWCYTQPGCASAKKSSFGYGAYSVEPCGGDPAFMNKEELEWGYTHETLQLSNNISNGTQLRKLSPPSTNKSKGLLRHLMQGNQSLNNSLRKLAAGNTSKKTSAPSKSPTTIKS